MKRATTACMWLAVACLAGIVGCSSDTDTPEDETKAVPPGAQKIAFRNGDGGYAGTQDLSLSVPANFFHDDHPAGHFPTDPDNPFMEWGVEDTWGIGSIWWHSMALQNGLADSVALVRFGDIFGNGAKQIPPGSEILDATLNLFASAKGDPANLHRIRTPWDESVRWQSFGDKPGPDWGTDIDPHISATLPGYAESFALDVKDHLAKWTDDPDKNLGWAFMAHGTQDVLTISESKIDKVTKVRVKLRIKAKRRAEVVVTLRHGPYTAVLINRPGRVPCDANHGSVAADFDVIIDQDAEVDIHSSDHKVSPLVGSFKPDGVCVQRPMCTTDGGGLCGQKGNGQWILTLEDEWANIGKTVHLESWTLELDDDKQATESHTRDKGKAVPNHNLGGVYDARIWTSEAPKVDHRPKLTVTFKPSLSFVTPLFQARTNGGKVQAMLRLPGEAVGKHALDVKLNSDNPAVAALGAETVSFAKGDEAIPVELTIGKAGFARITADGGADFGDTVGVVQVGDLPLRVSPPGIWVPAGSESKHLKVSVPAGATSAGDVVLMVESSDPSVIGQPGATKLVFKDGEPLTQKVELLPASAPGEATITVTDSAGTLGQVTVPVRLSDGPALEMDMLVAPYIQLGEGAAEVAADSMRIAWQTTTRRTNGPNDDRFAVTYRPAGSGAWQPVTSAPPEVMDSNSKHRHVATLSGLKAGLSYEYRIVQMRNGAPLAGRTWTATFKAKPTGAFSFAAMGNTGTGTRYARSVADVLKGTDVAMISLLGDFVYDKGEWEHYPSRAFGPYEDIASRALLTYTVGNHDVLFAKMAPISGNFLAPANGPAKLAPGASYVFDFGDVRFFALDSSLDGYYGPKIEPWLKKGLAESTRKWNVVMVHEPPLTLDPQGVDRQANEKVRKHMLRPAVQAGADLFLAGAVHSYQRYLPITSVPAAPGTVKHAACAGGKGTTLVYPGSGSWARVPPKKDPPPPLKAPMVVYLPKIGLGMFEVDGDKLTIKFITEKNQVLDEITLTKCATAADCACK